MRGIKIPHSSFWKKNGRSISAYRNESHPDCGVPFALMMLPSGIWDKSNKLKVVAFVALTVLLVATLVVFLRGKGRGRDGDGRR